MYHKNDCLHICFKNMKTMIAYNNKKLSLEEFEQESRKMFENFTEDTEQNYVDFWHFCQKLESGGLILMFDDSQEYVPVGFCVPYKGVWVFPGRSRKRHQNPNINSSSSIQQWSNNQYTRLDQKGKNGCIHSGNSYKFKYIQEEYTDVFDEFNEKYMKPYFEFEKIWEKSPNTLYEICNRDMVMDDENLRILVQDLSHKYLDEHK